MTSPIVHRGVVDDLDARWFDEHPEASSRVRTATPGEVADQFDKLHLLLGPARPQVLVERLGPHARRVTPWMGGDQRPPLPACRCTELVLCHAHAPRELL